jgi:hypothetical protein
MAPTKANATYAVTTLSLLTKVMGMLPWFTSCPQITLQSSKAFPAEKGSGAARPRHLHRSGSGNVVKNS